jgi:hypothetical protein
VVAAGSPAVDLSRYDACEAKASSQLERKTFFRAEAQMAQASTRAPSLQPAEEHLAARSGRDRRQLGRQREAYIFTDQIEIALIRESQFRQAITDLLDEHFGR